MERTENPEISPHLHSQMIFNSVARPFNGGRTVISINSAKKTGYLHAKNKIKLDPSFTSHPKVNSK